MNINFVNLYTKYSNGESIIMYKLTYRTIDLNFSSSSLDYFLFNLLIKVLGIPIDNNCSIGNFDR